MTENMVCAVCATTGFLADKVSLFPFALGIFLGYVSHILLPMFSGKPTPLEQWASDLFPRTQPRAPASEEGGAGLDMDEFNHTHKD